MLLFWVRKTNDHTIKIGGEAAKFVKVYKLKEDTENATYIKHQIRSMQKLIESNNIVKENDIKKYLIFQTQKEKKRQ